MLPNCVVSLEKEFATFQEILKMLYTIFCNICQMIFCIRIIELRLHEYVIEKETEYVKHSFNVSHVLFIILMGKYLKWH